MMVAFMRRFEMMAILGLLIVLAAFVLAYTAAENVAFWLGASKATREAAGAGSALVTANVTLESLRTWVAPFKFAGLALLLGGITMALGLIAHTLRELGKDVMAHWPKEARVETPRPPLTVMAFRMAMMLGLILVIISLVVALQTVPTVASYWNHAIASQLDPAPEGSFLLSQLGFIQSQLVWIDALKFLGMALLFTGITLALTVIIRTLKFQEDALQGWLRVLAG